MSRRKVEVRRDEILRATVEEVTERGFASTRVADVAGRPRHQHRARLLPLRLEGRAAVAGVRLRRGARPRAPRRRRTRDRERRPAAGQDPRRCTAPRSRRRLAAVDRRVGGGPAHHGDGGGVAAPRRPVEGRGGRGHHRTASHSGEMTCADPAARPGASPRCWTDWRCRPPCTTACSRSDRSRPGCATLAAAELGLIPPRLRR